MEVGDGEGAGGWVGMEVAVVAEEVFAEGVCDHFIHVDGYGLAGHCVVRLRWFDAA